MPNHSQHNVFSSWIFSPFFDLSEPNNQTSIVSEILSNTFKNFTSDGSSYGRIRMFSPLPYHFRDHLVQHAQSSDFIGKSPLDVSPHAQSDNWKMLCEACNNFSNLASAQQARVLWVLTHMGFHDCVLALGGRPTKEEIREDHVQADLAACIGLAQYTLYQGGQGASTPDVTYVRLVAEQAPKGSQASIDATYWLAQYYIKYKSDVNNARAVLARHLDNINAFAEQADAHDYHVYMSRYHRIYAMLPQLETEYKGMSSHMELALLHANKASDKSERQSLEKRILKLAFYESWFKEALVLGDYELAESRVKEIVKDNLAYPSLYVLLGQVSVELGKVEQAISAYRTATRLGPPCLEIAWFMLGQCYEFRKEYELAADAYMESLKYDPLAISAIKKLSAVAKKVDTPYLKSWSKQYCQQLEALAKQKKEPVGTGTQVYKKYKGVLSN
jgi:tetratricopeptide (TPR) repeat protein